jgi:1-phosphofructokinase
MAGEVMVLSPAPRLTVTIETRGGAPDIHLHAGGQGVWQARMVRAMGVPAVLCAAFGGETGRVVHQLLVDDGMRVRAVEGRSRTGGYVHDRRGGERAAVAEAPGEPLDRHELDELYGLALTEGLRAGVALLGGPGEPPVVEADMYRRLAADLGRNGCTVLADLRGEHLRAAAQGGLRLAKVSHEELLSDGDARSDRLDDLIQAACALRAAGAEAVLVTRAEEPSLVVMGEEVCEVSVPRLEAVDASGAGDSTIAATAAVLARGESLAEAIRLGAAAGALNVTRHGLGSGQQEAVTRLRERVRVQPVGTTGTPARAWEGPQVRATPEQLSEHLTERIQRS